MKRVTLKVHPEDNIIVALQNLAAGAGVHCDGQHYQLLEAIPAKHKFAAKDFAAGEAIKMYGVIVGKAVKPIPKGSRISTDNIVHDTLSYQLDSKRATWVAPDVKDFAEKTFLGYHRADGKVGTMNYWLVVPLVFCENRNLDVIEASMREQLGYVAHKDFAVDTSYLIDLYRQGRSNEAILQADIIIESRDIRNQRVFENVDGIKFLRHDGGCGAIDQDITTLCRLLAGYIVHPNVAGATILSLGCQKAQYDMLQQAVQELSPTQAKPIYFLEQQQSLSERTFISDAVKQTFVGLIEANQVKRAPAPLAKLVVGLECGGSDGFSGISANPTLGYTSDMLVALGAATVLAEFPELSGVEQELISRCTSRPLAEKFAELMEAYHRVAVKQGSGFENNPSPGNVKDGLITDAMKSAGAAKKGGTSPITDVLDYTETVKTPGLNLLCTPGNDVESTTGLAGAGATIILFTTGLGTPTGNPIAPVIKVATNNAVYARMNDIIDFNTGRIITGESTPEEEGAALLDYIIEVASGRALPAAVRLGQDDFIPWKRGISL